MTPAVALARKAGIDHRIHQYEHDPRAESYGLEAAQALNLPPERVFKTLLVALNGQSRMLGVAVLPVNCQLNLKSVATALKAKRAEMANPRDAERATGYLVGGISPLGQKRRLPTVVDNSASGFDTVFVSAGRRGLEIELSVNDLLGLTEGRQAAITA